MNYNSWCGVFLPFHFVTLLLSRTCDDDALKLKLCANGKNQVGCKKEVWKVKPHKLSKNYDNDMKGVRCML